MFESYRGSEQFADLEGPGFGAYENGSFESDGFDPEGMFEGDGFGDNLFENDSLFEADGLFENDGMFEYESYSESDGFENYADGEDPFLGSIWKGIKKVAKTVAPLAKKFAPHIGSVIGGALGGPAGAALGGKLGSLAKSLEGEDEGETEDELNAVSQTPAVDEAMAESMAAAAVKTDPIVAQSMGSGLTITIASNAPLPVKAVLPVLARAGGDVARRLAATRDPRVRTLIRTLPTIQRRTIATLTAKARTGRPITPRTAVRVMHRQANRVLNSPQAVAKALASNVQKSRAINKAAVARAERFY